MRTSCFFATCGVLATCVIASAADAPVTPERGFNARLAAKFQSVRGGNDHAQQHIQFCLSDFAKSRDQYGTHDAVRREMPA